MQNEMKETGASGAWKWAVAVGIVSLCWGALRLSCCEEALDGWASLRTLYEFRAPLPFGKRVLTTWMAHALAWGGLSVERAFEWVEILGAAALAEGLLRTFRPYFGERRGRVASLSVFGFLATPYLLRSTLTLYLPWDIWAMALTAWGIHFLLEGRWLGVVCTMALASFNRESAVLLPMLCAGISAGRRPWWRGVAATVGLLAVYAACRWVAGQVPHGDGEVFKRLFLGMSWVGEEWEGEPYRLLRNWEWLGGSWERGACVFGAMGGLPAWFLGVSGRLPGHLRRFGLAAWGYLAMLMVVGNVDEVRIYGETIVVLYVPTVLGICDAMGMGVGSMNQTEVADGVREKWLPWVEGACVACITAGLAGLGWCLSRGWGP